jgi:hypothetical protein
MNMTFFLYIIKDVMDYNGFYGNKGNNHARELKLALHRFDLLTEKLQYIQKA